MRAMYSYADSISCTFSYLALFTAIHVKAAFLIAFFLSKFCRNGSVIVDFLIFTSPQFSGSLQDLQDALASRFNNSHLGTLKVKDPEIIGKNKSF